MNANQIDDEAHIYFVSLTQVENQTSNASYQRYTTQDKIASHTILETQDSYTSCNNMEPIYRVRALHNSEAQN